MSDRAFRLRLYSSGVSMVDMLITASLIALLVSIALPMGTQWVEGIEETRASQTMQSAEVKAQTFALRNPNGITNHNGQQAALTALCYEPDEIEGKLLETGRVVVYLREGGDHFAPCAQGARSEEITNAQDVWSEAIAAEDLVAGGFQEVCFDNRGSITEPQACGSDKTTAASNQDLLALK